MASATEPNPDSGFEDELLDELSPGTTLLHGQYTIESFLNSGGFGITYLAHDSLDRKVVIKECFPSSFCRRSRTVVHARSRAHQGEFHSVVKLFVQEARSLAKLNHPNIVGVHQVFEDNSTAYMALDLVEGRDLLDTLEDENNTLTPDQIKDILVQVLDAVGYIHSLDVLHRDISPDNILLTPSMTPILIDFGAAREQAAKSNRVLSALLVVKDGYSPQEFYISGSEQSPSSDLYALGASFYHLIAGEIPPNSQLRLSAMAAQEADPYVPLTGSYEGYDEAFLMALDKSLQVMPKDRLSSAQEWLDMINGIEAVVVRQPMNEAESAEIDAIVSGLIEENADTAQKEAPSEDKETSLVDEETPLVDEETPSEDEEADVVSELSEADSVATADSGSPKKGKGKLMLLLAAVVVGGIAGVGMKTGIFTKTDTPQTPTSEIGASPTSEAAAETSTVVPTAPPVETTADGVVETTAPPVEEVVLEADTNPPAIAPVTESTSGLAQSTTPNVQGDVEQMAALNTSDEISPFTTPVDITEIDTAPKTTPPLLEELGAEVLTEPSLPDTVLEASSNPPPVVVPVAPDMHVLTSTWSVELPFHSSGSASNIIGTVKGNAETWMQPGGAILAVNGTQITAISDINTVLHETVKLGDSTGILVEFEIGDMATGATSSHKTTLPIIQEIRVLNGTRFQTVFVNGRWQTQVVANLDTASSDLKIGDVLIADLTTSERFSTRDAVAVMINDRVAKGQEQFKFIVDRDGSNWFASLNLSGVLKADTAPAIEE